MKIETLLRKEIGLNPESIGKNKIASDIRRCMAELGIRDEEAYVGLLQTSTVALEKLIEAVTVPETWFFRYRGAFDYLAADVRDRGSAAVGQRALRILSVPCASGEEAYSIAMTLLQAGLSPGQFHIDAADVSRKMLADAERAVYGKNSFRGKDLAFRKRFFLDRKDGYELLPEVKETVRFIHGNILAPFFLSGKDPYDVIFCRNLLIYFEPAAQCRTAGVLSRLLKENGRLFTGHAETGLFTDGPFLPVRQSGVFAFHKQSAGLRDAAKKNAKRIGGASDVKDPHRSPVHPVRVERKISSPWTDRTPAAETVPTPETPHGETLKKARSLADEGRLFEAAELCEALLKEDDTNTEATCLMGLIRLALKDDAAAEQYFDKAVYMNPDHYEALVHLALLKAHRGDRQGAQLLQQRAERAGMNPENRGVQI